MPTHLRGDKTIMNVKSKVANKSSDIDKSKDLIEFIMRPINQKEKAFLKSQGEPVDEGIIYVIEKKKMSTNDC